MANGYQGKPLSKAEVEKLRAGRERAHQMRQAAEQPKTERIEMLSELDRRLEEGRRKANGKFYGVGGRRSRRRRK